MHQVIAKKIALLAGCVLILSTAFGCDSGAVAHSQRQQAIKTLSDQPLADSQAKLLDIAFKTATSIPVNPHIKDRSKSQEAVVLACLEVKQPAKALEFADKIEDFRRGSCYAELAFYCASKGGEKEISALLDKAEEISNKAEDWRRDTIRVKIAKTHALLKQSKQADQFEQNVVDSEAGKVAGVEAMIADDEAFDRNVEELDALVAKGNYDILNNALHSYSQLFHRFYRDAARRALVEEKIKTAWAQLPIFLRMDLLMALADFALDHEDPAKALELVNETQAMLDGHEWPLENKIPLVARLATLRFRAGDAEKARADADAILARFDAEGKSIVNIYRAGALRPLAEAYQAMGDTPAALSVYKKAIEEGVENPNSRPRAEDLAATCGSMAVSAVEPDEQLWARIHEISERLGDPW